MKLIRVGAAALNTTPLDWNNNERVIREAIAEARAQGVSVLCLPELCITGYGCEDAFHAEFVRDTAWSCLRALLPLTRGGSDGVEPMILTVGLPVFFQGALYNCAALIADGKLLGLVPKKFLAGDGIHYEPRWFKAWPSGVAEHLHRDGLTIPIGDLIFEIGGVRFGFEICEDAWVSNRPGSRLAARGVDVILNPSASHFAFGKVQIRKRFVMEGSRAYGVAYVYSNLMGNESGRVIFDGGTLIGTEGKLVATGPRFSFLPYCLTTAIVDIGLNRLNRARQGSFQPDPKGDSATVQDLDFKYPHLNASQKTLPPQLAPWEGITPKEEEFARAVALGLFDYMRKSSSHGFVVSLSGGADSAAVSCLVTIALRLALLELGPEKLKERLSYLPQAITSKITTKENAGPLIQALLTCAYQASPQSGPVTEAAARTVAQQLGAQFFFWRIDDALSSYIRTAEAAIGRPLSWEGDDITLQNIQARVRAPSIWMIANIRKALLLATSNRSEAAVGYATMDGDTCGGLSPIAGIDKAYLRRWLCWLEKEGLKELGPFPALKAINAQAPTAELRPAKYDQTDEKDLMPYDVLDAIERLFIRDKFSPAECLENLRAQFPAYDDATHAGWVRKFFKLFTQNQWKRERYAPSFHLDDESLDPKSWCRFPILSGGFSDELGRLERRALILVDLQKDFAAVPGGGALAVPDGQATVAYANERLALRGSQYAVCVATQDWHPANHGSFASQHSTRKPGDVITLNGLPQVLWPNHCVQGTSGAEWIEGLEASGIDRVFPKGTDPAIDSYSGFYDNGKRKSTGLGEYLKAQGIRCVDVLGLATDFCVKATALDAKSLGFEVRLLLRGCRGVDLNAGDSIKAIEEMRRAGIVVVES